MQEGLFVIRDSFGSSWLCVCFGFACCSFSVFMIRSRPAMLQERGLGGLEVEVSGPALASRSESGVVILQDLGKL